MPCVLSQPRHPKYGFSIEKVTQVSFKISVREPLLSNAHSVGTFIDSVIPTLRKPRRYLRQNVYLFLSLGQRLDCDRFLNTNITISP